MTITEAFSLVGRGPPVLGRVESGEVRVVLLIFIRGTLSPLKRAGVRRWWSAAMNDLGSVRKKSARIPAIANSSR